MVGIKEGEESYYIYIGTLQGEQPEDKANYLW